MVVNVTLDHWNIMCERDNHVTYSMSFIVDMYL